MKSLILAAGKGARLKELTKNIPKCLVKIQQKSLIEYQLEVFESFQFKEVILIAGYKSEKLKFLSKKTIINKNYDKTNMLYSLYCALDEIKGDLLISYGDSVFDKAIIERIINSDSEINIASDSNWKSYWESRYVNPLSDLETYKINSDGNVLSLGEKPTNFSQIEGQYIGLIKLSKKGSEIFKKELVYFHNKGVVNKKSFNDAYLTDFLQALILKGYRIKSQQVSGNYIEIDTIEDIESPITQNRIKSFNKKL
jgi:L-glutamine-phosphate cytidylyltransferase